LPGGLAADPQLEQDRVRALGALVNAVRPAHVGGMIVRGHDPGRHWPDGGQPVRVGVDKHEVGHLGQQPADPVRELRRVGGPSANDGEFHS